MFERSLKGFGYPAAIVHGQPGAILNHFNARFAAFVQAGITLTLQPGLYFFGAEIVRYVDFECYQCTRPGIGKLSNK